MGFFIVEEGPGHLTGTHRVHTHGGQGMTPKLECRMIGFTHHIIGPGLAQSVSVASVESAGQHPDTGEELLHMLHHLHRTITVVDRHDQQPGLFDACGFQQIRATRIPEKTFDIDLPEVLDLFDLMVQCNDGNIIGPQ